ncbi:MAG: response regulator [Spirochaetota bacterium]|nr:response regulator [Spirochaetota bacterium]
MAKNKQKKETDLSKYLSPTEFLLITLGSLFLGEGLVMLFLHTIPIQNPAIEGIVDALLISALAFPMLYIFMYRPIKKYYKERSLYEKALEKSEERYRHLVELSPNGIIVHNNMDILFVNQTGIHMLGLESASSVMGHNLMEFIHPDYKELTIEIFLHANEQTTPYTETRIQAKDGFTVDVELASTPITFYDKPAVLTVIQDITQRKWVGIELQKTLKELSDIKFSLDEHSIVAITDKDGIIKYANDKFCAISKFKKDELIGQSHKILRSGHHPKSFFKELWDTISSGKVWKGEIKNRSKDGSHYWVETTIVPFLDEVGLPYQYVAIRTDITERKRIEEELRHARDIAEEANQIKGEFLANMSHEIRTPMNGIIGMTELALSTELTPEQRDYLSMVKTSAHSLLTLINDILDFSKIEAGKLDFYPMDFSLRNSLGDTMHSFSLEASNKNMELILDIDENIPDNLVGDPGRLRQVLVNLISNAIKFSGENGNVLLKVQKFQDNNLTINDIEYLKLHFYIQDNGIGIANDKQKLIFNSFTQADSSMTKRYGGTGLGLTISRRLVELMEGNMWLESEINEGSTFHFTALFEIDKSNKSPFDNQNTHFLTGQKILVVDDNDVNRRVLNGILNSWEIESVSVDGGKNALEQLNKAQTSGMPYQIAILDIRMPEMDGFTLTERIKGCDKLKSTKIIVLTSSGRKGDAEKCRQLGVLAYLHKPVKHIELLHALKNILAGKSHSPTEDPQDVIQSDTESKDQKHILLVEDNPVNQKLSVYMLENWGHTVVLADNGLEALQILKTDNFDLILMDVQMPELNGIETTIKIRDEEKISGKHIPIIALTAYAMKGDREDCLNAGMDDYLSKPIKAKELFDAIENITQIIHHKNITKAPSTKDQDIILDLDKSLDRLGDDQSLLLEVIDMFLDSCQIQMGALEKAIQQGEPREVEHIAHTFKGAVSNFEAKSSIKHALKLELMGREGDITLAKQEFALLQQEVAKVVTSLEDYRNQNKNHQD